MKGSLIFSYVLAGLILVGFFGLLGLLVFRPTPVDNSNLLNISVGALISAFTGVVGYFFGSSLGSKEKNQILADKTPNKPEQPAV